MEIDARPYRAPYNPAFLKTKGVSSQSGPHKLNGDDRSAIAKAYFAGCGPRELADQYSTSMAHILTIARRHDEDRYRARRKERAARAAVVAPKIETPMPELIAPAEPEIPHYVVRVDGMAINLPMLSILHEGNGG